MNLIENMENNINNGISSYYYEEMKEQYNNSFSLTNIFNSYILTYKNKTFYIADNEEIDILKENLNRKD